MLTIAIPTYNNNVTNLVTILHKELLSLDLAWEIIIGDDCSTIPIINKSLLKGKEITLFQNQKNIGRVATRIKLAQKATYQYILFLDADVKPSNKNFIKSYIITLNKVKTQCIYGGVSYQNTKPDKNQRLRWYYGKKREAIQAKKRHPYYLISQNILIKKDVFLKISTFNANQYGLDLVFSAVLQKENIKVTHINNPSIHLGLESNQVFLKKSLEAVATLVKFENNNTIPDNFTKLQQVYKCTKGLHLTSATYHVCKLLTPIFRKIITNGYPFIIGLDLIKLGYYTRLKKQNNA